MVLWQAQFMGQQSEYFRARVSLNLSSPVVESEEPTSLLLTIGKQCIPASPRYPRLLEEHQGCSS